MSSGKSWRSGQTSPGESQPLFHGRDKNQSNRRGRGPPRSQPNYQGHQPQYNPQQQRQQQQQLPIQEGYKQEHQLRVGQSYPARILSIPLERTAKREKTVVSIQTDKSDRINAEFVQRFTYNAKLQRSFLIDDELEVIIISSVVIAGERKEEKREKEGQTIHYRVCPTREYVRPLLILDINGVLGEK